MTQEAPEPSQIIMPEPHRPVILWNRGQCQSVSESVSALLPGSFNPLHFGHRQLRQAASEFLGCEVGYELSVSNVDKPQLSAEQVRQRVTAISEQRVYLTQAPRFADKAKLFPGAWLVVGFDTAVRILDLRYHAGSASVRDQCLAGFCDQRVRFLVAGRQESGGDHAFQTHGRLRIPSGFTELFVELPERLFRADVSSTDIRRGQQSDSTNTDFV